MRETAPEKHIQPWGLHSHELSYSYNTKQTVFDYQSNKTRLSFDANAVNVESCACVVGYLSTFEWENARAIYCF